VEFRTGEDGRWVLGNPVATCRHCGAPAAVHYAENGKAEVWHAPTDCCAYSRARERRFDEMRQEDDQRADRAMQEAQAVRTPA
jgi:hypothetical protein